MELSYIREFIVLTETKNYLEAAEKLFTTQSTLTRHIQALEKEMGVKLFDRTTRSCTLNDYGRLFLPYAKEITALHEEYNTALLAARRTLHGNVRIGSLPMMVPYGITDTFIRFKEENPSLSLEVIEADSSELIHMLKDGQCDFVYLRETPHEAIEEAFHMLHFSVDRLAVITKVSDPLAKQDTVQLSELKDRPFLFLSNTSMMYKTCIRECRNSGFEPHVVMTASRAANLLDLIRKNMGIGILTKKPILHLLGKDLKALDIVPEVKTFITLCYLKNKPLSPASACYLEMVRSMLHSGQGVVSD